MRYVCHLTMEVKTRNLEYTFKRIVELPFFPYAEMQLRGLLDDPSESEDPDDKGFLVYITDVMFDTNTHECHLQLANVNFDYMAPKGFWEPALVEKAFEGWEVAEKEELWT